MQPVLILFWTTSWIKKKMFFFVLFYRIYSAVVRLRTGAGKNRRKHANGKLSILVYYPVTYLPMKNPNPAFVWFINRTCFCQRWHRRFVRRGVWGDISIITRENFKKIENKTTTIDLFGAFVKQMWCMVHCWCKGFPLRVVGPNRTLKYKCTIHG